MAGLALAPAKPLQARHPQTPGANRDKLSMMQAGCHHAQPSLPAGKAAAPSPPASGQAATLLAKQRQQGKCKGALAGWLVTAHKPRCLVGATSSHKVCVGEGGACARAQARARGKSAAWRAPLSLPWLARGSSHKVPKAPGHAKQWLACPSHCSGHEWSAL